MTRKDIGGIIHVYQKYNPTQFPSPTAEPTDLVSGAFDHALTYGRYRELTEEELARAVRIDPSQFANLGPSIDMLRRMLEAKKRKILETYSTHKLDEMAMQAYLAATTKVAPPDSLKEKFACAVDAMQIYMWEQLWYLSERKNPSFSANLLSIAQSLGNIYEIDDFVQKYTFTGHEQLDVEQALELKQVLEQIDELLKQLEEAEKTAQIGLIDMDALSEQLPEGNLNDLEELREQIRSYVRELAELQGLERDQEGNYQLTPQAHKTFQSKLLSRIFSALEAGRSGRHEGRIVGDGSVEIPVSKPYEFGDSIANLDSTQSVINAMLRQSGSDDPLRLRSDDLEVFRTRNSPKCATVVAMDMSGSMRYDGQYVHVKRMGLALQGLITKEFPGDFLRFIEMYSFAKLTRPGEIVELMPKPVTIHNPVVRLKADLSDPNVTELDVPPHFTNIQHALRLARQNLATVDTPNKQIILITDGLPTAHFEGETLFLLYPPDPRTEKETVKEAMQCAREGITINIFLIPSWSQSEEDIRFAHRLAEQTQGRVFFTSGGDLDKYVLWDYVERKREIL